MPHIKSLAAAPAMLAALSLTFTPAAAAELPLRAAAPVHAGHSATEGVAQAQTAEHGRHRHRHRYYRYRRGPGVGDVIAGVLIIGAIAHAAKAASRNDDRRYRDRDDRRDASWDDERGIDRAVEMCIDAVERERRVETVDRVDRTARGWMVEGTVSRGDSFRCRIGNDGRIDTVDFGGRGSRYEDDQGEDYDSRFEDIDYDDRNRDRDGDDDDGQWDDDRYASEWSRVDRETASAAEAGQPAYPGGPVDGDEEIEWDLDVGTGYPGV